MSDNNRCFLPLNIYVSPPSFESLCQKAGGFYYLYKLVKLFAIIETNGRR